ncbi:hypothetical protein OOZ15_17615 [Galbibacter sp. EGI 63066]|uniref:hypothetical protein n=1 Tax=Galbibacter sp. EGI 63066 TaxID=2993559 RepID=UPI00224978CD|nr:hypothetical protein [Galbibacter sp. EGI 63066]MCX2681776.1 hypothetical protein [Galbibacter sp. EGI 63066]
MKQLTLLCLLFFLIVGCKKKDQPKDLNPLEKIAYAHGLEHWDDVETIEFTFNVDRDTEHFERSWSWKPKENEVSHIDGDKVFTYNRSNILSDKELAADKNFINDMHWLVAPYKLVWDRGIEYEGPFMEEAPVSKDSLQRITITYDDQGGYTPGDAYDFYVDENNEVKEWIYREDNTTAQCMITTWEDYKEIEGLKIATMHQNENGVFKLYFTNINVVTTEK